MFELAKNGEITAVMPININDERQAYLDFSDEAIIQERMSFITSSHFDINYSGDLTELTKYQVAGISGYYYGEAFAQHSFEVIEVPNEEAQVKMLLAGRFPLALIDTIVLSHYIQQHDNNNIKLKPLEPHLYKAGLHLAFAKSGKSKRLATLFSEKLSLFKSTLQYQQILQKYQLSSINEL